MKKKWLRRMTLMGCLCTVAVFTLAAQGTKDDPLVTLGHLNEQFMPKVAEQIAAQTADRQEALEDTLQKQIDAYTKEITRKINRLNSSSSSQSKTAGFSVVELEAGYTLMAEAGCELMLRSGNAVCVAKALPGFVDTTSGGELNNGSELEANHLYLATDEERGVMASDAVTLLVRGNYTIV